LAGLLGFGSDPAPHQKPKSASHRPAAGGGGRRRRALLLPVRPVTGVNMHPIAAAVVDNFIRRLSRGSEWKQEVEGIYLIGIESCSLSEGPALGHDGPAEGRQPSPSSSGSRSVLATTSEDFI